MRDRARNFSLTYKRLRTGYHYVRPRGYHHMFAQFKMFPCTAEDISHNGVSPDTVRQFVDAVNRMRDFYPTGAERDACS